MGGCREQRDERNLPREKVQPEESYSPAHSFLHPPHTVLEQRAGPDSRGPSPGGAWLLASGRMGEGQPEAFLPQQNSLTSTQRE